ncbi:ATP-binding protein [Chryseolinea sp. H1M3-3]|uniref:ATP-binding protein n=1 Tax=Chryseolinea sp. H1M3-3 TaxID=3034144 RepID=UPI0023EC0B2F|nr:ATP-binding protein [Chryseolinea sp. H1M3-3]
MTKTCFVFLCYLFLSSAFAQAQLQDTLLQQLEHHPEIDTVHINLLNALSHQNQWKDFNKSLVYATEALKYAEQLSFESGIAQAYNRQAHCYWALGDSDRAIEKALHAVAVAERSGLTNVLGEAYRTLAMCYRDQQELAKAVAYIRHAEALATQKKNWDLLARVFNLAGVIAHSRAQYDSALIYYNKSLQVTSEHAITTFHVSQALSNMGEVYLRNDPEKALGYFNRALASAKETQNRSAEAGILADVGRALLRLKKYAEAERYLNQSLVLARTLGLKRVIRHVYLALTDLKITGGKTTDALNYMQAYYDVRDSLLNGSKTRQIVELETRFEKEKQEQKIQLLEQEKRIQSLWQNVLIVGSMLLVIALVIIYRLQQLRSSKSRQLLEAQQALNNKLKETDALKSKFFANLSHEFRTPLTLILSPVEEQLRNFSLPESERKKLTVIQRNAHRLLDLVNQLLDLSKLEAGKMELSIHYRNLSKYLHVLISSFDSLAEHKQIDFIKNISTYETPVGFDADKIEKIVSNILFNAFKFTPAGGQVIFSMHVFAEENEVVMTVADTGKGIPTEEHANVFSPFYQLKPEEENHPGTGLGLSLVHELVKLYEGTIELTSEVNKGTCIVVTLPLFPMENAVEFPIEEKDSQHDVRQAFEPTEASVPSTIAEIELYNTILVVEDNTELRNFIISGFENQFAILSAVDGEEGVALALEHIPDVIISDVMMPRMNGLDLISRIRKDERTSHIPVVLLTAKVDDQSKLEGLKTGADEYLAKPFLMEELQVRVNNVIEQRKRLAIKLKQDFADEQVSTADIKEPSLDEKFIAKVRSIVEANIGNSFFSVEMLAAEMNLSRAQLFRKLKALINTSPSEYIHDLRLQRAAKLIRAKADNVAQIGYAVGFNEQSYFAKRFRKKYGVSPTEYAR